MAVRTGSRAAARAWWAAALVSVPALIAGLSLLWPGPGIADDLRVRSEAALGAAGLGGVTVAVSGRDVELGGVPRGSERLALDAMTAVPGLRDVSFDGVVEPAAPARAVPTAAGPSAPPDGSMQRQDLAAQLDKIVAEGPLTFPADSAELTGPAAVTVARLADVLRGAPDVPVELVGFAADAPGPPETALALSERRAAAVAEALVVAGVDSARITVTGRGATQPLETQAASRRVEISVS